MILLDNTCLGVWFIVLPGNQDWMAGLNSFPEVGRYKMAYRFRYIADDVADPSITMDRKRWTTGEFNAKDDMAAITVMRRIGQTLCNKAGPNTYLQEVLMNREKDVDRMIHELSLKPWGHSFKL